MAYSTPNICRSVSMPNSRSSSFATMEEESRPSRSSSCATFDEARPLKRSHSVQSRLSLDDRPSANMLATRSCRLITVLSMCSSLVGCGFLVSLRRHHRVSSHGSVKRGPRVCIVSDGALSTDQATAVFAALLHSLVRAKQAHVTVLRLQEEEAAPPSSQSELAAIKGVHWTALPPTRHKYDGSAAATASFRTLEWLRGAHAYDHIVFHEVSNLISSSLPFAPSSLLSLPPPHPAHPPCSTTSSSTRLIPSATTLCSLASWACEHAARTRWTRSRASSNPLDEPHTSALQIALL